MDISCQSCSEPFEFHYLRYQLIQATDLNDQVKQAFKGELTPIYRQAFDTEGWVFGESLHTVKQCPCCPRKTSLLRHQLNIMNTQ